MKTTYQNFRYAGYNAKEARYASRAVADFKALGEDKVKLSAEPEHENYFDIFGEPEGYTDIHGRRHSPETERKEIIAQIERDGCYCVRAHYFDDMAGKWICCDSIGMCIYNDPLNPVQNTYVPDLMRSAVEHYNSQFEYAI